MADTQDNSTAGTQQNSAGAQQDAAPQDTAAAQNPPAVSTGAQNDELTALQTELTASQAKLEELTNIAKHALADLQNVKRRSEEDQKSYVQYALSGSLLQLLPAIENIHRALAHEPKDPEWIKGAEQTFKQILQTLEKNNVKIIPTTGAMFDPKLHEALMTAPGEKDIILEEFEKGYTLNDKVLKPARVKVGNGEYNEVCKAESGAIKADPEANTKET